MNDIQNIPISKIQPHPKNPRIVQRDNIIETIKTGIEQAGEFHKSHAIKIRSTKNGSYYILSGHHRFEAAKQAGLTEIPCWVLDDISAEEAYLILVTDNTQSELSPLEYGLHALHYVKKSKGGSGNEGGLSAYARKVGKTQPYWTQVTQAAEVAKGISQLIPLSELRDKAQHLTAIYKVPEELWGEVVEKMLKKEWSVNDTQTKVKYINQGVTIRQKKALLEEVLTIKQLNRILQYENETRKFLTGERKNEWIKWYEENDPLTIQELHDKRYQLEEEEIESEGSLWSVEHADIRDFQTDQQFDFIITDPPYPKEFLELYEVLAQRATEWLKDDGLLIAMCGQSYFTEIIQMMGKHLDYYWTACYLTPGQPKPLRQKQVNTTWKPLLIFTKKGAPKYAGKTFGDVFVSDKNEKEFDEWSQSVSGMSAIIEQICLPEQHILDPFCGGGTTGLAAIQHGCYFHGIDIDENDVTRTQKRLMDYDKEEKRN